ncbi:MAG: polysaccharide deacetylase family protein [Desulfovibrio sp.]|nr:polysaccharide deacetylase family protein [Desulfovibrio sp.]
MMQASAAKSLPVLMHHYVNDSPGAITVSPSLFEEHCRIMAEEGWRGVDLAEAEEFFLHGRALPEKSLLVSFDDGFLDNCLYALPVLRAYGHKAVVFAVANRLEAADAPRVPIEDLLAGKLKDMPQVRRPIREDALGFAIRKDIFCNRPEVRAMEESGVIAVASHSRGHFGVFAGPEFTGFAAPGDQKRTFYLTEHGHFWGLPAFRVVPGLRHRAFLPNPDLLEGIRRLVPQSDAEALAFFASAGNLRELQALAKSFAGNMGRFEDDTERRDRMWREIAGGKEDLESVLGHSLRSFAWPWGKYCPEAEALAREAGFSLLFTTGEGPNPPLRTPRICRFKAKSKSGAWLISRLRVYSRPLIGAAYARLRNLF